MNRTMKITVVTLLINLFAPLATFAQPSQRETPIVRAVRAAKDAVVNISTSILVQPERENDIFQHFFPELRTGPRTAHSLGSGFIIHPDGYLITNAHVVKRANEILVTFSNGESLKADAWYVDDQHDLAVVKIKNNGKPLPVLPMGRGDDLMIGETVIAIGNALGYQHTVTTGVLSATDRTLDFRSGETYRNLIQTDASINPGNSGGPLLNIDGRLIGINTAIRGDAQNIGFAINVDVLKRLIPDLLSAEDLRRINLGFRLSTDSDNRVRVVAVNENSPALKAGLRAGDIVTHYDNKKIKNPIDLYVALLERPAGSDLALRLQRGSASADITMPFNVKPKPDARALARARLGLILEPLSADQSKQLNLGETPHLIVRQTLTGSEAEKVGLRNGDILNALDRYRVNSFDDVGRILESAKPGQKITIAILRIRGNFIYSASTQLTVR